MFLADRSIAFLEKWPNGTDFGQPVTSLFAACFANPFTLAFHILQIAQLLNNPNAMAFHADSIRSIWNRTGSRCCGVETLVDA